MNLWAIRTIPPRCCEINNMLCDSSHWAAGRCVRVWRHTLVAIASPPDRQQAMHSLHLSHTDRDKQTMTHSPFMREAHLLKVWSWNARFFNSFISLKDYEDSIREISISLKAASGLLMPLFSFVLMTVPLLSQQPSRLLPVDLTHSHACTTVKSLKHIKVLKIIPKIHTFIQAASLFWFLCWMEDSERAEVKDEDVNEREPRSWRKKNILFLVYVDLIYISCV